jgi:2-methylcitrate dehydratase
MTSTRRIPRSMPCGSKMEVVEEPRYTRDYLDPEKRSIANAIQVFFTDGSATEQVAVEYPIGHRRRRDRRESRSWRRSSGVTWPLDSHRGAARGFSRCVVTRRGWKRRQSIGSWTSS